MIKLEQLKTEFMLFFLFACLIWKTLFGIVQTAKENGRILHRVTVVLDNVRIFENIRKTKKLTCVYKLFTVKIVFREILMVLYFETAARPDVRSMLDVKNFLQIFSVFKLEFGLETFWRFIQLILVCFEAL